MPTKPLKQPNSLGIGHVLRLALLAGTAALGGCASGDLSLTGMRDAAGIAEYQNRQGNTPGALDALQRAADVAPNNWQKLRALRRMREIGEASPDTGMAARSRAATEQAALLGDQGSLNRLAADHLERDDAPDNLIAFVPLFEKAARGGSDPAARVLAKHIVKGRLPGGQPLALAWLTLAANRGSVPAMRDLALLSALNDRDEDAVAWAMKAHQEDRAAATLRFARGFSEGTENLQPDPARAERWLLRAAAQGGKATDFAAAQARQWLTGSAGTRPDPARGKVLLAAVADKDKALADKVRLAAAGALLTGKGAKRDLAAGLALVEQSAATGSVRGRELAASAAMRLARGTDGYPKDKAAARRLQKLVASKRERAMINAALDGGSAAPGPGRAMASARAAAQAGKADVAAKHFAAALKANPAQALAGSTSLFAALEAAGASSRPLESLLANRANQGHRDAMLALAEHEIARALLDPSRYAAAESWLRKAADAGDPGAQYKLGLALAQGTAGPADPAAAKAYLLKAQAGGHPFAAEAIERLGLP